MAIFTGSLNCWIAFGVSYRAVGGCWKSSHLKAEPFSAAFLNCQGPWEFPGVMSRAHAVQTVLWPCSTGRRIACHRKCQLVAMDHPFEIFPVVIRVQFMGGWHSLGCATDRLSSLRASGCSMHAATGRRRSFKLFEKDSFQAGRARSMRLAPVAATGRPGKIDDHFWCQLSTALSLLLLLVKPLLPCPTT